MILRRAYTLEFDYTPSETASAILADDFTSIKDLFNMRKMSALFMLDKFIRDGTLKEAGRYRLTVRPLHVYKIHALLFRVKD